MRTDFCVLSAKFHFVTVFSRFITNFPEIKNTLLISSHLPENRLKNRLRPVDKYSTGNNAGPGMLIYPIIQNLLNCQDVSYRLLKADKDKIMVNDAPDIYAQTSFLRDNNGIVISIYDIQHQLDLSALRALTDRPNLRFMSTLDLEQILDELKNGLEQDQTMIKSIQFMIDEPISNLDSVLLVTDNPERHIQLDIWDMQIMLKNAMVGGRFSNVSETQNVIPEMNNNLYEQLKSIKHLPMLPAIVTELLELKNTPDATVDDLVKIISHDPSLTAQVLRYANSALFGFSGQIINLHDAIFRVLGFETVQNMAFGAALGRSFKLPNSGRLSMENFWKEATYRAALCQQLSMRMPVHTRPPAANAYITGLLHNIGVLLMGHLFYTEFDWLNKMLTSRPDQSLIRTEKNLFNCTHTDIGEYVLNEWHIPAEISVTAGQHHTENYSGPHSNYVWLVQLAGLLLEPSGLAETDNSMSVAELCQKLELTELDLEEALENVLGEKNVLQAMVDTLCA